MIWLFERYFTVVFFRKKNKSLNKILWKPYRTLRGLWQKPVRFALKKFKSNKQNTRRVGVLLNSRIFSTYCKKITLTLFCLNVSGIGCRSVCRCRHCSTFEYGKSHNVCIFLSMVVNGFHHSHVLLKILGETIYLRLYMTLLLRWLRFPVSVGETMKFIQP